MSQSIVFFATAWGTRYGGINSFNYDICRALAKLVKDKYEVICVVPCVGKKQVKEAKKEGVKLVKLRPGGDETSFVPEDIEEVKKLFPASEDEVLWWIGHDVKTGPIAIDATREIGMGQTAIFHHMDYESYLALIPLNTKELVTEQRNVLNQANIVFAIGPRLARSARDKVSGSEHIAVKELFPGSHDIKGLKAPEIFSVIVFGRLSAYTDCVKQAKLAVAGFGHACSDNNYPSFGHESKLMVIGLPDGKQGKNEREQLKAIAAKHAGRAVQIHPWSYFEDREKLFEELKRKSVCLVTSLYEGFGLVGWEAICAGVPLIVSENTGLYEFVKEHVPGGRGCLESIDIKGSLEEDYLKEDVEKVSRKILKVRNNIKKAKEEAITLKEWVGKLYTWEKCALAFAKALGIIIEETQDEELFSEDMEDKICRLCHFSKAQLYEMFEKIKRFYGL